MIENKEIEVSKEVAEMYLMNHMTLMSTLREAAKRFSERNDKDD
jgi:hypothetical protein